MNRYLIHIKNNTHHKFSAEIYEILCVYRNKTYLDESSYSL